MSQISICEVQLNQVKAKAMIMYRSANDQLGTVDTAGNEAVSYFNIFGAHWNQLESLLSGNE